MNIMQWVSQNPVLVAIAVGALILAWPRIKEYLDSQKQPVAPQPSPVIRVPYAAPAPMAEVTLIEDGIEGEVKAMLSERKRIDAKIKDIKHLLDDPQVSS